MAADLKYKMKIDGGDPFFFHENIIKIFSDHRIGNSNSSKRFDQATKYLFYGKLN